MDFIDDYRDELQTAYFFTVWFLVLLGIVTLLLFLFLNIMDGVATLNLQLLTVNAKSPINVIISY